MPQTGETGGTSGARIRFPGSATFYRTREVREGSAVELTSNAHVGLKLGLGWNLPGIDLKNWASPY